MNLFQKLFLEKEYNGYERLNGRKCYKQIVGPHSSLEEAMKKCNELEKRCNGIQFVKCKGAQFRITKSLLQVPCTSKPEYIRNPNCDIIIYQKGICDILL